MSIVGYNIIMQHTTISEAEFIAQVNAGDLRFEGIQFNFPVELHSNYEGEFVFDNCRFIDEVSFANAAFLDRCTIVECHFHEDVDFALCSFERFAYLRDNIFHGRVNFKRTIFSRNVNFNSSIFMGEVYFDHSFFKGEASFYRTKFQHNLFFHKSYLGVRADFSYVTFSPEHTTSFFAVQNSYELMDGTRSPRTPPVLIFRFIYFPRKTLFTNVDLSHSIFQDCYLIPIIFKNCFFAQVGGRSGFYQEHALRVEMATDPEMFDRIKRGIDTMTIRLDNEELQKLQVHDIVTFYDRDNPDDRYPIFITWLYRAGTTEDLFNKLEQRLPYTDFDDYRERLGNFYSDQDMQEQGLVGFSFKKFSEYRHWENLEDINRQMKRSLEDSRDWQKAGDFYVGEMNAMIKRLTVRGEKKMYRFAMRMYGWLSGYCESFLHIILHMVASFSISILILHAFRPELTFASLFDSNFRLFIPVFGNNTATLAELELVPWQNMIMEFQVVWYYLLWLFLALTLQRKFKR